jgi:hypothetical protein
MPPVPNVASSVPSAFKRISAKSLLVPLEAVAAMRILPSAWTATASATSVAGPTATVCEPPKAKPTSRLPSTFSRVIVTSVTPENGVLPTTISLPSTWRASARCVTAPGMLA